MCALSALHPKFLEHCVSTKSTNERGSLLQTPSSFQGTENTPTNSFVLAHLDPQTDTEIHTDASNKGLGAVLVQHQNGVTPWRHIAHTSSTLSKAKNNYSTTEKECLAVVWTMTKFPPYLHSRPFTFVMLAGNIEGPSWTSAKVESAAATIRHHLRIQTRKKTQGC